MHHIQSIILTALFTPLFLFSKAQTTAVNGWLLSLNSFKIKNSPFSAYFDAQFRSSDQLKNMQTVILRPGLQYNLNKKVHVTLGYAFVESRRTISGISGYAPEHRIWQQLMLTHPVAFTTLSHRFRLEQRFIAKSVVMNNSLHNNGHSQANRFRYFFRNIIPLSGARKLKKDHSQPFKMKSLLILATNLQ